jgi:hypothetical protein
MKARWCVALPVSHAASLYFIQELMGGNIMKVEKLRHRGNGSLGGPKTKAGKGKSRLNSFKHGLYARKALVQTGPYREIVVEYEELLAALVKDLEPTDSVERSFIETAADAWARKNRAIRSERARVAEGIEEIQRASKKRDRQVGEQRLFGDTLTTETKASEGEQGSALAWDNLSPTRLTFIRGMIEAKGDPEAAAKFQKLRSAQERKEFFHQIVGWDDLQLYEWLTSQVKGALEDHLKELEKLTAMKESQQEELDLKLRIDGSLVLPEKEADFLVGFINRCQRQYERAIEDLMRYRAMKRSLVNGEGEPPKLLKGAGAEMVQEN